MAFSRGMPIVNLHNTLADEEHALDRIKKELSSPIMTISRVPKIISELTGIMSNLKFDYSACPALSRLQARSETLMHYAKNLQTETDALKNRRQLSSCVKTNSLLSLCSKNIDLTNLPCPIFLLTSFLLLKEISRLATINKSYNKKFVEYEIKENLVSLSHSDVIKIVNYKPLTIKELNSARIISASHSLFSFNRYKLMPLILEKNTKRKLANS